MRPEPRLAVVYEHPEWFNPLFAVLERRGIPYLPLRIDEHHFDLSEREPPAPVIFSRVAMSSFLRQGQHAIFYAQSLYAHWAQAGARIINGNPALAVDTSKARQMSLINALGYATPATRVVHRREDLPRAAQGLRFPLVVKVNIGGSGAGVVRYDSLEQLTQAVAEGTTPESIDSVLLVQEFIPTRDRRVVRAETLDGRFLYAISLTTDGGSFDLCPADACRVGKPAITITRTDLDADTVRAVEAISRAAHMELCGIEFMIDERDGSRRFYDINGLSNFVARPLEVLGWDPHEQLVDYLEKVLATARHGEAA
ncbi:ATP-grasp domain-containing protein [Archangium primigenium]|uniref:ATP-grasp domain-containing protein n=1 Tax=[Archangium] primigenium TaxID=2792470 RepID=UPI00195C639B|nr:alpha-L-glutamate ligase [Archangium primigenium]MBM7114522.1 alpha-L-glutamate ligase [Archangium primigenium]